MYEVEKLLMITNIKWTPPGYFLDESGLYFSESSDNNKKLICDMIHVLTPLFDDIKKYTCIYLRFTNQWDKKIEYNVSIPFFWLEDEKKWILAITLLRDSGFYIKMKRDYYRIFFNYIELLSKRGIEIAKNYYKNKPRVEHSNFDNPYKV